MTSQPIPIFTTIVCGVDATPAGLDAVRQASRLVDPGGSVHLVTAASIAKAAQAGMAAVHAAQLMQDEAQAALTEAEAIAPEASSKLVGGNPAAALLREAETQHATLLAVGSHDRRRTPALLLGTVAASMLRDAPCSVLIARAPRDPDAWPESIVAGIDGSAESAAAAMVARELAERFGGSARVVASTSDQLDAEAARVIAPDLEELPDRAVDLLATASESADLIVIGSRGLHGMKALGSVSERVAHRASCSVLVVRTAAAG